MFLLVMFNLSVNYFQINLGVINENPASIRGVATIMDELHKQVPARSPDDCIPIVCYGDGLSIERMHDVQEARASALSVASRLEGLYPCPQDFHRRALLLQVN